MASESRCIISASGDVVLADDNRLPVYSITKPLIASLVMQSGIRLTRPVADWFDGSLLPKGADFTVEHLLNHTSGLRDYGALPAYQQAIADGDSPWSDETFAAHTLQQPLLFEPGHGRGGSRKRK